mmetsp:Transcript_16734/g.25130  ORF Transcript_16734/g.25130 Transcript_16734/m.25130 type:complete len:186 (-) Transcript_16734:79-636(-)
MSVYDAYISEITSLCDSIRTNIDEFKHRESGTESCETRIDALFSQASNLVRELEVEIRSMDAATRKTASDAIGKHKSDMLALRSEFESARTSKQRSNLIGTKSSAEQNRYLSTNERLNKQSQAIANITQTVAETEEVGLNITQQLGSNREKIGMVHGKVNELDGDLDRADTIANGMLKREKCSIM